MKRRKEEEKGRENLEQDEKHEKVVNHEIVS